MQKTKRIKLNHSIVLATAVIMFVFEQSPANEALRAIAGFKVLDLTDSPWLVGVAVLMITLIVEFLTSFLIALGVHGSKRFQDYATQHRSVKSKATPRSVGLLSDGILSLTVGAGVLVIKRYARQKNSIGNSISVGLKAAVWIAVFSGLIAYLASGGVEALKQYGMDGAAEIIVTYGSDWRFWAALLLISQTAEYLLGRYRKP